MLHERLKPAPKVTHSRPLFSDESLTHSQRGADYGQLNPQGRTDATTITNPKNVATLSQDVTHFNFLSGPSISR